MPESSAINTPCLGLAAGSPSPPDVGPRGRGREATASPPVDREGTQAELGPLPRGWAREKGSFMEQASRGGDFAITWRLEVHRDRPGG